MSWFDTCKFKTWACLIVVIIAQFMPRFQEDNRKAGYFSDS